MFMWTESSCPVQTEGRWGGGITERFSETTLKAPVLHTKEGAIPTLRPKAMFFMIKP